MQAECMSPVSRPTACYLFPSTFVSPSSLEEFAALP